MLEKIKIRLTALLSSLGSNKNKGLMVGAALVLTAAIVTSLWRSEPNYVPLYGTNEKLPMAQLVEVLGAENIAYRVNPDNGQILVAESKLPRARMALAAKGISALLPEGYELMDKEDVLGSSQFVQNVRYKRSLEGELSKSVMGLEPVISARVHLGLSEASSFVMSNKPESSASVMVQLHSGKQLDDQQVSAIVQLVSGSVPGMKASNVRVVDQSGNLLSENIQNTNLVGIRQGNDVLQRLKGETEKNIALLLTSLVGSPHFRISVAPQLNMNRVEETQESLGKEGRISEENVSQENTNDDISLGVPGSLSNRPVNSANNTPATTAPAANEKPVAEPRSSSNRNQEQRKYLYDREVRHTSYPGYQLEKMRVAIALDQAAPALANITPEKIASLTRLLEEAAGIDKQRGDSLTLDLMAFTTPLPLELPTVQWWQDPSIRDWGQLGGLGFLAILTLLLVVRPLMQRVSRRQTEVVTAPEVLAAPVANEATANDNALLPGLASASFQNDDHLPPQSSGLETKVEYLQVLAESQTERVAEVLKQWINSNERSNSQQ